MRSPQCKNFQASSQKVHRQGRCRALKKVRMRNESRERNNLFKNPTKKTLQLPLKTSSFVHASVRIKIWWKWRGSQETAETKFWIISLPRTREPNSTKSSVVKLKAWAFMSTPQRPTRFVHEDRSPFKVFLLKICLFPVEYNFLIDIVWRWTNEYKRS